MLVHTQGKQLAWAKANPNSLHNTLYSDSSLHTKEVKNEMTIQIVLEHMQH